MAKKDKTGVMITYTGTTTPLSDLTADFERDLNESSGVVAVLPPRPGYVMGPGLTQAQWEGRDPNYKVHPPRKL